MTEVFMRAPRTAIVLIALLSAVSLAACKSSSSSNDGGSAGSTTKAATATFSGDFSGTMTLGLCTGGIGSLQVTVTGDSNTYLGSVSGKSMGFVGPAGGPFAVPTGGQEAKAAADGNSFDVTGVVLKDDTLTHKSITVKGTLTCP
jgi:hypothetical protein